MASIQGQIDRLTAIERRLNGGALTVLPVIGADLAAQIANRVISTGEDSQGGKFSPYSTKDGPAWWYFGRSVNAGGEAKVRAAAKKKEGVSYSDFRLFNNRGVAEKNFFFRGEMWRGFGFKSVTYSGGVYTVILGGKTKDSADKIGWMSAQEGRSIIAPNMREKGRAGDSLLKFAING